jgi:hypothetical protein
MRQVHDLVNLTVKANPFFRSYPCFRHGYELAALVRETLGSQPAKMRAAPMCRALDVVVGDGAAHVANLHGLLFREQTVMGAR